MGSILRDVAFSFRIGASRHLLTYKATNDSGLLDVDWYVVKFKKIKEKISGIFTRFAHKNKK